MVQDQIRYDILVQDALRGVIAKVLAEVAKAGLPGDHHFFITFMTTAPGVKISSRLKERYPEQMTIVLQHQFWDLNVHDNGFEVSLHFGDIPEKLSVPFSAVQVFYDPTAAFEAAFDLPTDHLTTDDENDGTETADLKVLKQNKDEKTPSKTNKTTKSAKPNLNKSKATESSEKETSGDDKPSADVVSLDAFRKNK
ncbi:SspB family protein [Bartonella tamiae]|uniref:Stringent starvation protein B n=1 Tax=Bartonella tamiae Th239 TaxID=1094558 RepID=J0R0K6_9HYPH|nr:ClpXP protease specificity-enhancing factor SspB [Bartonella tamiae]EJF89044.1 hypothetical protein ME5_01595 [Bartonella tamiae Th239]EJF94706.1 hypothetical protein MEG_00287 [Bartonella tamiae Th307]